MIPTFIDHIVIVVKGIEETERFYTPFLGTPTYLEKELVVYKIGDTMLFFRLPNGEWQSTDKDRSGLNHLAFGVRIIDELNELENTLTSNGIINSGIKVDKQGGKDYIWFDDPSNIRIEFYCRPE